MKRSHKYLFTPFIYFLLYLIAVVPYFLGSYLSNGVFELLCIEFPTVFHSAPPFSDPEGFLRQSRILVAVSAAVATFILSYVSLSLDNKRFEFIIEKTEGRFTMRDGLLLYYREFLLADILTAALPPVILALPALLVPGEYLKYGLDFALYMEFRVFEAYPPVIGTLLLVLIGVIIRPLVAPLIVSRWRAGWLSGAGMEG